MNLIAAVSIALASWISSSALADAWAEADSLFDQRQGDLDMIAQARAKYLEILETAPDAQAIRAASQLGRLAIYEGRMLRREEASSAQRRRAFADCWCADPVVDTSILIPIGVCEEPGFMEKISPEALGERHPAYFYFKSACMALWLEEADTIEKVAFSSAARNLVETGERLDRRFEGGGILRVRAGVLSNPLTAVIGEYDLDAAEDAVDEALASEAYPGDPHSGASYFENWLIKADILIQKEDHDAAEELVSEKIEELQELEDNDDLPSRREPESLWVLDRFKVRYLEITGDSWDD